MSKSVTSDGRSLGTIESDMLAAGTQLAEAEERLEQAMREKASLMDQINDLQSEFDSAVEGLRRKGPPGSTWNSRASECVGAAPLNLDEASALPEVLSDEDEDGDETKAENEGATLILPHRSQEVSREFAKLRNHVVNEVTINGN